MKNNVRVKRRTFIKQSALAGLSIQIPETLIEAEELNAKLTFLNQLKSKSHIDELVTDELYWKEIRKLYAPDDSFLNLENGYFTPMSLPVMYAEMQGIKMVNSMSSKYMRTEQENDVTNVHKELERFLEISKGKIAICRNTTEALDTVIHGINWQKGDEIITGNQDYYSMIHAIEQEVRRNDIKRVEVEVPIHPKNDEEIVAVYENAITSKTRYILLTHIINTTGHILPAKKIIEMAHKRGVQVIVDSAHAVAHFQFNIDDFDPDYLGCSLHKWLGCPLGVGLLYVKNDRIAEIWPLFGDTEFAKDDIRKFRHWGTRPVATLLSVKKAIEFHNTIGSELKERRLRYLNEYWVSKVQHLPNIVVNTPDSPERYCAIANIGIKGMNPVEIQQSLFKDFEVFTVAIEHKAFNGIRVTPHLYTSVNDLDKLVEGIKTIAA